MVRYRASCNKQLPRHPVYCWPDRYYHYRRRNDNHYRKMNDEEKTIIFRAQEIVESHGVALGFWDSWRGFGKFVRITPDELFQLEHDKEQMKAAVLASKKQ